MRVVFRVVEEIPGLADRGDLVALFLDGRERPVVRMTYHGPDTVRQLAQHKSCLRPHHPEGEALDLLREVLGSPSGEHRIGLTLVP